MLDEPLGLTVHTLPSPQDAATGDARRTSAGRLRMLLVLLVCAAPVVASYVTYYFIHPQGHAGFGELIEPQRPIPALPALTLDGKQVSLASLQGQWLIVSVAGGNCDGMCERHLYFQRQLRETLGREKERVDWVWLVNDRAPVRASLLPALAQATVLRVEGAQLAQWLAPDAGHAIEDHLYLVDPLGHWMMRFPAGPGGQIDVRTAKDMKRDLDRLLRASASWDKPGRE